MGVKNNIVHSQKLSIRQWWERRRWKYNGGLIVAGITAFFAYAILGIILFANDIEFEITIFTITFQAVGYLIMMTVANLLYFFCPIADNLLNRTKDEEFSKWLFNLVYWFSVAIPFLVPFLLIINYLSGTPSSPSITVE